MCRRGTKVREEEDKNKEEEQDFEERRNPLRSSNADPFSPVYTWHEIGSVWWLGFRQRLDQENQFSVLVTRSILKVTHGSLTWYMMKEQPCLGACRFIYDTVKTTQHLSLLGMGSLRCIPHLQRGSGQGMWGGGGVPTIMMPMATQRSRLFFGDTSP